MKRSLKHKKFYPVSVILSFILTILLTAIGYLSAISLSLFRSDMILECADKTGYYKNVYDELLLDCVSLGKPLMLPEETFQDVFSASDVYSDTKEVYYARLYNRNYTLDTSKFGQKLKDNIYKFAGEENLEIGEEQEKLIDTFVASIENKYLESVEIPFITYYISVRNMYNRFFLILIAVLAVMTIADIFLLLRSRKYKHQCVRYITYATIASAITTGVVAVVMLLWGGYGKLNIKPEYFYSLVVELVNASLYMLICVSLIFVIISAVLIFITGRMRNKLKNKSLHSKA